MANNSRTAILATPMDKSVVSWAAGWRSPGEQPLGVEAFLHTIVSRWRPGDGPNTAGSPPRSEPPRGTTELNQQPSTEPAPDLPGGAPVPGTSVSSRTGQPEGVEGKRMWNLHSVFVLRASIQLWFFLLALLMGWLWRADAPLVATVLLVAPLVAIGVGMYMVLGDVKHLLARRQHNPPPTA